MVTAQTRILSALKKIVNDDFRCPICLDPFACDTTLISLECGHRFCGKCIKDSLSRRCKNHECPTCRVGIPSYSRSYRADLKFDRILTILQKDLIHPLETELRIASNNETATSIESCSSAADGIVGFPWQRDNTINALRQQPRAFEGRVKELMAFKIQFGHCNIIESTSPANRPYLSLSRWCTRVRRSRRLIDQGEQPSTHNLSEDQIAILDDVGFPWQRGSTANALRQQACAFEGRVKELMAFKIQFGHCNIMESASPANTRPYLSLSRWCTRVRRSRRLIDQGKQPPTHNLSKDQIAILDDIGFPWQRGTTINALRQQACAFEARMKELKAFKIQFGHCNVTHPSSSTNKQYLSLSRWCTRVRRSRRLIDQGKKPPTHNLSKDQIAILDDIGFSW